MTFSSPFSATQARCFALSRRATRILVGGVTFLCIGTAISLAAPSSATLSAPDAPGTRLTSDTIAAPAAPKAPTFSEIGATSLKVHLPALPSRAVTLSLQQKLSVDGDEAYVTIETGLSRGDEVLVGDLQRATTYAFRVIAVGPGGSTPGVTATVTTASMGEPDPRPETALQADLLVRGANDQNYIGDNFYSVMAVNQAASQMVETSETAFYHFKVENDGKESGSFTLHAPAGGNGWGVQYFDALAGGNNITAQITGAGGWSTSALAPNTGHELRLEVTPDATVGAAVPHELLIVAKSAGVEQDAVEARTSRFADSTRPDLTLQRLSGQDEVLTTAELAPVGSGVFNLTGSGQSKSLLIWLNRTVSFQVNILNPGRQPETYRIKAPALEEDGWMVRYYDGINTSAPPDVTAQVTQADGWEVELAPGEEAARRITIVLTPIEKTAVDTKTILFKAVPKHAEESADNSDAVKVEVSMQYLGAVEWSYDSGRSWHPGSGSGGKTVPAAEQSSVIGFRAVKGKPNLPWPTKPAFKPAWTVSGYGDQDHTYIGDKVWIHCPRVTSSSFTVSAECGNSVSALVAGVVP